MLNRRVLLAAPLAALLRAQPGVRIHFDGKLYRVVGWTPPTREPVDGWGSILSVYTVGPSDAPPALGSYSVQGGELCFTPRFPMGVASRAVFRAVGSPVVETVFTPAVAPARPLTRVDQVYPTASVLPANLLRLYLQFSSSMRRGEAWEHVHLLDNSGKRLELPFLELDQELWDADTQRLTVLFDPGRIKRGVMPRDESGTALVEGSSYTLSIDKGWPDKFGAALASGFAKQFRVGPEARGAVDLKAWHIQAPLSGTTDGLVVAFPAPLDYALVNRLLAVHGKDGRRIEGSVTVERMETLWRLRPSAPWLAGEYTLQVDTALEDVAGNRVGKAFDVDVFGPITPRIVRKMESIAFRIS